MIRVNIVYEVPDKEGRSFRSTGDIAKDVDREMWESPLFSEAGYYQIIVRNETEHSVIEYQKEGDQ